MEPDSNRCAGGAAHRLGCVDCAAAAPAPSCWCIEQLNEALAPHNARLDVPLEVNFRTGEQLDPRIRLSIFKLDPKGRKRLPYLTARFCPLCGAQAPLREGEEWADGARPIATILLRQLAWDLRNLIGNFHLTETGHEMKDEVDERWGKLADALGLDLDWLWADERPSDPVEVLDLQEEKPE